MNQGWIKLHRQITEWEWYTDGNTFRVFLHLIINANHKPKRYKGILIERGQILTGRKSLSVALDLTERQVRTALTKLKNSGEITQKTTSKTTKSGSIITICNYDSYQERNEQSDQQNDQQTTSKRPRSDQEATTNKNDKNNKNVNNEKNHHQAEKNDDDDLISLIDIEKLKKEYKGIDVLKELQEIEKKISGQKISVPENYVRQCLNNMLQKRKIAAASTDDYRHFDDSDYMSGIPTGIKVVTF
jgi:hypothetical protein